MYDAVQGTFMQVRIRLLFSLQDAAETGSIREKTRGQEGNSHHARESC